MQFSLCFFSFLVATVKAIHDRIEISADGRLHAPREGGEHRTSQSPANVQKNFPKPSSLVVMRRSTPPHIEVFREEGCSDSSHMQTIHLPADTDWVENTCVRVTTSIPELLQEASTVSLLQDLNESQKEDEPEAFPYLMKMDCSEGKGMLLRYHIDANKHTNFVCKDMVQGISFGEEESAKVLEGECIKGTDLDAKHYWFKFKEFLDKTKLPECMAGGMPRWLWWLIVGGAVVFVAGILFFGWYMYHRSRNSESDHGHSRQPQAQMQQPLNAQYGAYPQQGVYPQQGAYPQQGVYPQQGAYPQQYAQQQVQQPQQ